MKKIFLLLTLLMSIIVNSQTTTWDGTTWSNGTPTFNRNVIINGNYTVGVSNGSNNFSCRTLTINNGFTFRIKTGFYVDVGNNNSAGNFVNNGTVIVESGSDFLIYVGSLINNSDPNNFIIEDGGSMIQLNNSAVNSGSITFKRNTKPVKLNDYTYWSSPVNNQRYDQLPPNPSPIAGLRVFGYDNLPSSYYGWNPVYATNSNGTMINGKGYIAHKGIVNDPNPQQVYTMNFIGIPNNGNISITLTSFIGNRPNVGYIDGSMYLVGNPYPSVLDMRNFLTLNGSSAIYLWTHNTIISSSIPGSELYNYTNDDYATYNLTGGVSATSPILDGTPNNTSVPTRYIGSGQGFFVKAPQLGSKTFNFNNSIRSYIPNAINTQFYRESENIENNRVWLFLTNNFNITRYNMIGYVTGATNGFDHQYDAETSNGRVASIYSILGDKDLTIQGRELPFDINDQIPLGYKLPEGGSFQIGLNDVDGLFTNISQPIYIQDNLLGITHNLRNSNYSFIVDYPGVVEDRFVLKFKNETLSNNDFISQSTTVFTNNTINIISTEVIKVYDVLGRVILVQPGSSNSISLDTLNRTNGVLLLEVLLDNGMIVKKKVSF